MDETSKDEPTLEQPAAPGPPPRTRLVRKLAVAGSAAALAIGVGLGIGGVGTGGGNATSSSAQNAAATTGGAPSGAQRGPGAPELGALAKALGVSEAKLEAAMQAGRGTAGSGTRPSPGTMAADLATRLGLSQAKVEAALAASMPARPAGAPGSAPGAPTT